MRRRGWIEKKEAVRCARHEGGEFAGEEESSHILPDGEADQGLKNTCAASFTSTRLGRISSAAETLTRLPALASLFELGHTSWWCVIELDAEL